MNMSNTNNNYNIIQPSLSNSAIYKRRGTIERELVNETGHYIFHSILDLLYNSSCAHAL